MRFVFSGRVESRDINSPSLSNWFFKGGKLLTITKEFTFDAAHRLCLSELSEEENENLYGKCSRFHGHTYRLQVSITGEIKPDGMIINFTTLKHIVKDKILSRYDHAYLNDLEEYKTMPPTAEAMCVHLFKELGDHLKPHDVSLTEITLYETPTSKATITAG